MMPAMTTITNGIDTTRESRDTALARAGNALAMSEMISDPQNPFPFEGDVENYKRFLKEHQEYLELADALTKGLVIEEGKRANRQLDREYHG